MGKVGNGQVRGKNGRIYWPRLIQGTLIKRYKRFMADVKLRNGHMVTAHCPNSGSMLECCEPGRPVYLSRHNNPTRKFKYTWEIIEMPSSLVGINTLVPNRLVKAAIVADQIPQLMGYEQLRTEVKYGENSRIDILLEKEGQKCLVEVKNCTLVKGGTAYFPDAVTSRGLKHLLELQREVRKGNRGVMFYLIQRMDGVQFSPADHIDPSYGRELRRAMENGVEILAYDVVMDLKSICINGPVPIVL